MTEPEKTDYLLIGKKYQCTAALLLGQFGNVP